MSKFDPPTRTPIAYGYSRVSHTKSFEKGDSLPSQELRIQRYYEAHLKEQGVEWGGCRNDEKNISAYRTKFQMRPAGRELMKELKKGDHLIVDKVDRLWRSTEDFVLLMSTFEKRGITVHIVSFLGDSIKTNTGIGSFMLKIFVLVAELESDIKSERIRDALEVARKKGRRSMRSIPPGCRVVKRKRDGKTYSMLEWCEKKRTIMKEIVRLIDDEGLQWHKAYKPIEEFVAKIEERKPRKLLQMARDTESTWPRMYQYEVAYHYLGIKEPSQIPKLDVIKEAARQHKRRRTALRGKSGSYKSTIPKIDAETLMSLQ